MLPYLDVKVIDKSIIREFSENLDSEELKWHRDQEDRVVEAVEDTDWSVQLDNKLPILLKNPIFIPKGVWHRAIKGTGSLLLKITKK
jgi:hypothetical protein